MIRVCLRFSAALLLLFVLVLVVIHAQPRDDSALRSFFTPPEGCAAPCFAGIRIGETPHADVIRLLHAQPWIGMVFDSPTYITWTWNGQQPSFVFAYKSDSQVGRIDFRQGVAYRISLATTTTRGDFLTVFTAPAVQGETITLGTPSYLVHYGGYAEQGFVVQVLATCPLKTRDDLWYSTVMITWPTHSLNGFVPVGTC
jgi:hypothetical protein